ncbi:MAG TPA: tannase/feruloyl esterase family alpha/beta hydrolase [Sphingomonadaceae bacterium]|nr:tannase/feruloyl esterase family alpha/beta hydrolase [Sphingomonadaceae bacterium]
MVGRIAFVALAGFAAVGMASPAAARTCGEIARLHLEKGKITAAEPVAAGAFVPPATPFGPPPGVSSGLYKGLPAFCRVRATLAPTPDSDIKVEIWLPEKGWNGKFVGVGNGIWAGQISYSQMGEPLARGYAVASTDTGHSGNGLTAEWAVGHPEKLIDFAYRAVHVMTVTAKQVVRDFFGAAPRTSLWNSCSTGGRQGLMAAYRYPDDYDAISAMAPANPMTDLMTQTMWTGYQALRSPAAALPPTKLALVHKAVVAQCDAEDGLKDGLISLPGVCRFDPASLQCKPGQKTGCLDADQVAAMRNIYGGVRDAKTGAQLLPGFPRGSEMQLATLLDGPEPFPVATSYFRLLVFADQPNWDWRKMNYARDLARARQYGAAMLDIPADGLAPFFARGGKLLLSHGWTDGLIPANNTVAFYRRLHAATPAEARQSVRLFMVPGMNHCRGGEGPSSFDTLGVIDHWATHKVAPNRIIASRPAALPGEAARPPLTRPLCPFPLIARYRGDGSPNEAKNFVCAPAATHSGSRGRPAP